MEKSTNGAGVAKFYNGWPTVSLSIDQQPYIGDNNNKYRNCEEQIEFLYQAWSWQVL